MTVIITLLTIILSNKMTTMRIGTNFVDMDQKILVFHNVMTQAKLIIDTFSQKGDKVLEIRQGMGAPFKRA